MKLHRVMSNMFPNTYTEFFCDFGVVVFRYDFVSWAAAFSAFCPFPMKTRPGL